MTTNGNTQPDRIDQMMALLSGFIEETREFMAEQKQFNAKVTEDISRLTDQVGQLITQVNGLTDRVDGLTTQVNRLTDRVDGLTTQVNGLTDRVDGLTTQVNGLTDRVDGLTDRVDGLTTQVNGLTDRVDGLTTQVNGLTDRVDGLTTQVDGLTTQVNGLTIRVDGLTRDVSRLTDDVGQLKGFHVRAVALQRTGSVARAFGLSEFHVLSNEETSSLANRLADYGVKENERISFAAADLIIEAHGAGRSKHYIAAEISYTANLDDVRRVIRNAGHLRLLTGSDSHAAIMGCEKTPDVDEVLANGSIIWHLISNRAMAPA